MAPFIKREHIFKKWGENSLGNLMIAGPGTGKRASLQMLHFSVETKHSTVNVFPFPKLLPVFILGEICLNKFFIPKLVC